jgi:F-type H+-transporting ATPase subunit gamma
MSDSLDAMRRKMTACSKLHGVVRIMKIIAASRIRVFQRAALASGNYYTNIESALIAFYKNWAPAELKKEKKTSAQLGAIIFGTDQGLVGAFNERLAHFVIGSLKNNEEYRIVVIGERIGASLQERGMRLETVYPVPRSVKEITSASHTLLTEVGSLLIQSPASSLVLFHNRPIVGQMFEPICTNVLPLDESWKTTLMHTPWPTHEIPEILETKETATLAILREYLLAALVRSLAESMACENLIRFLSMQKAEKNIDDTLSDLSTHFNLFRHSAIDAELFDLIAGFSALSNESGI